MLSVILTAYDEPDVAAVHVRECMNSSLVPDEIIVVNDHGDPILKQKLIDLDRNTKVIYAYIQDDIPWNYTGARNLGVWLSRGDLLMIEDTDNIPSKEAYKDAVKFFEENPDSQRALFGRRVKVEKQDVISNPVDKWKDVGRRPQHDDTQMIRRQAYLKAKGYDERFAGKYAWACSDWRRRLQRVGVIAVERTGNKVISKPEAITTFFWTVFDAETSSLLRRRSYENYELASERAHRSLYFKTFRDGEELVSYNGHKQSPVGILNFSYEFTEL